MAVIIIVNWNNWQDTVRCLTACGHLESFSGAVIVVDNGSTNDSVKQIQAWARGDVQVFPSSSNDRLAKLETESLHPLKHLATGVEADLARQIQRYGLQKRAWYLVQSSVNAGFGAGNNIALRLSILDPDCQFFWCLNSDAVPEIDAWTELLATCENVTQPIVSGTTLLNYDRPDTIQATGSTFSRITLSVSYENADAPLDFLSDMPRRQTIGYPIGASLLLNRAYLEQHGMFDERYFLYFEEPDLVIRLSDRNASYCCPKAKVYHKGGQSTLGGSSVANRSLKADFEFQRSRVILARKIGGFAVLAAIFLIFVSIFRRLAKGRPDLAFRVMPAFLNGWSSAKQ